LVYPKFLPWLTDIYHVTLKMRLKVMSSAQRRENRKAGRVELAQSLKVVMGSIGGSVKYEAITKNISHSGIFLNFESPKRFPFTSSSILEIWVELEDKQTVFFNGKLARVVFKEENTLTASEPGIAIHIVQIDQDNERRYHRYIEDNLLKLKELNSKAAS
jgi:hypothetical protein